MINISNAINSVIYNTIACGFLAALTWMGLVWMLPDRPIGSGKAWVQGVSLVAIANILIWILLMVSGLRLIPLWIVSFWVVNAAIAHFVFPLFEGIKIPTIWGVVVHPVAIAGMIVLLGGATGFL